jgi:hypothetical protein
MPDNGSNTSPITNTGGWKMVISVLTATISPGKRSEAYDFWKRLARYHKQPDLDSTVMIPLQGRWSRIMLATRFSSMAALEEFRKKQAKDPEWQPLIKEWHEKEYTVPGTLEWNQYEAIE